MTTNNSKKIGIGIIGYGSIAKMHEQVLKELSGETGASLTAIADPMSSHADKGIRSFNDHGELLKLADVSAVIIATPPSSHYQLTKEALNAGKDVFLEKPPVLSMGHLQELERLAGSQGRVLFTGYHTRYRPEVYKAKEALKGCNILGIQVDYREDVVRWHGPGAWVFDPAVAGGGILIDSGINVISVLTSIIPDLAYKITTCDRQFADGSKVETSVQVSFEFANASGPSGHGGIGMDGHFKGNEVRRYELRTADHAYILDLVRSQLWRDKEILCGKAVSSDIEVDLAIEYRSLFRDFFDHLAARRSYVSLSELQFVLDAYKIA